MMYVTYIKEIDPAHLQNIFITAISQFYLAVTPVSYMRSLDSLGHHLPEILKLLQQSDTYSLINSNTVLVNSLNCEK
ncbi:hypothetical protein HI914_04493 [Erysiphe necator]|nr:hypothetical protein HI914_04493 [Erysiphe necator]